MDNLGSDLVTEETHLTPEPWSLDSVDGVSPAALLPLLPKPEISLESLSLLLATLPAPFKHYLGPSLGHKGDTQDFNSILGSTASRVHLTSKEALGQRKVRLGI